jgi:hypothetical protein
MDFVSLHPGPTCDKRRTCSVLYVMNGFIANMMADWQHNSIEIIPIQVQSTLR